jgi:hypothetical protein
MKFLTRHDGSHEKEPHQHLYVILARPLGAILYGGASIPFEGAEDSA